MHLDVSSPKVLTYATVCYTGGFIKGAKPGTIKAGELVKITEIITDPWDETVRTIGPAPHARIEATGKRWAWVPYRNLETPKRRKS